MKPTTLLLIASIGLFSCKNEAPPADDSGETTAEAVEPNTDGEASGETTATAEPSGTEPTSAAGDDSEAAAGSSVAAENAAIPTSTATPSTAQARAPRTNGTIPFEALALVPDDAALIAAFDLDSAVQHYSTIAGVDPEEQRALFARQLDPFLTGADVPEALRGNIRIQHLRTAAVAVWEDESGVLITDAAVLANAPADGEQFVVEGVTVARRGELLLVGEGARYDAMVSGEGFKGFDLATSWPEGAASIPEGASFVVVAPSFAELDDVPAELASVRRVVFGAGLGTESVLAFDSDIDAQLRGYLGRAQTEAANGLSQVRMLAPPFAQAWVGYVELVLNSLWAQVRLESEGTLTRIGIAAPRCGVVGSIHLAVLLGAAVSAGATELDGPLTPFEPVEQRIAEGCAAMPGPPPNLPRHFAAMAGTAIDGDRVVAMMDVGAFLRGSLPTLFQLLPYSLHHEDLNSVMGATPLGLAGLQDPRGHLGGYIVEPEGSPEQAVLVLPEGTFGYLPIPSPPGFGHEVIEGIGSVYSLPGSESLIRQELDPSSPWGRLMAAIPADSVFSIATTGDLFRQMIAELPETPAIGREARLAAISVGSDLSIGAYFFVAQNAEAVATATEREIGEAWDASMEEASEDERAMGDLLFGQFRESVEVAAIGNDVVSVRFELPGGQSGGAIGLGSAIMIPAIVGYLDAAKADPFAPGLNGIEPPKPDDPNAKP